MAKKILLVDDERSIREALSKVLREEQYEVLLAENGPEAIQKYGATPADLLLLDLNLPGGNGWTMLKWLSKVNPLLPVIIITGRSNQRELAEKSGADVLMEKPLDVPRLLQAIRELTEEPLEVRAERATHRTSSFRFLSCDEEALRKMLYERFTVPYPTGTEEEPSQPEAGGTPHLSHSH